MSTLLSARDLAKSFTSALLFEGVAIHVAEQDRLGIIGPNGAGKTTLLKILADVDQPDDGEIVRRRNLKLVYVEQDDRFPDGATPSSAVVDTLVRHAPNAFDTERQANTTLSKLGFADPDQLVDTLSGGWRKRLSLACALCRDPDVMMLDEPTNHLDLEGVQWLESFVRRASMAVIFVTHDRQFLENTAHRIIELSPAYPGGVFEAAGNYSQFVRRKDAFLDAQQATQSTLANKVRRDTAWLLQGIQGRQTRNKTQVDAAAQRRAELRKTADRNAAPKRTTTIDFQATQRKTKKLLVLHNVAKAMGGHELFAGVNLTLAPGQRIGLLGPNGAGKTTLLRLMAGVLEPDTGNLKRAANLRVVAFSQHRGTLEATETLRQALCPTGDMVEYRGKLVHVAGWARRFLFEADQLAMTLGQLSGGEQARVLIAKLMLDPADVLLLDEPTNDLDIPSLEVLEQALLEFPGAMVLVTHDRFMLERIATEYVALDGAGAAKSFMTYAQWYKHRTIEKVASGPSTATPSGRKRTKPKSAKQRLTYNEQREFDGMEDAILKAESEVEQREADVNDPSLTADHVRAAEAYAALSLVQERVRTLYERWADLEAKQA